MTGSSATSICCLPRTSAPSDLEELDLSDRITDAGLAHLAELVRLRKLDLSTQSISDKGLLNLAKLDALEELVLASESAYLSEEMKKSPPGSKITGSGLAALAGATKLTRLDLRAVSGLTDAGLRGLVEMTQLKSLVLPPQITDAGLAHLVGLTNLIELKLDDTNVTDAGIAQLAKLKSLESVSLKNVGITDAAVPHFAGSAHTKPAAWNSEIATSKSISSIKSSMRLRQ